MRPDNCSYTSTSVEPPKTAKQLFVIEAVNKHGDNVRLIVTADEFNFILASRTAIVEAVVDINAFNIEDY